MCAAPTAPTLAIITAEAIKQAGFTTTTAAQYTTMLARAQSDWIEEVKNDIYIVEKQLVSLQTKYVHITTAGLAKYSLPTDYGINLSMTLLDGDQTGTFQAGSTTTSWVLAAAEDETEAGLIGKEILVYAGTAIRQIGQVTAYNTSTTTATVSGCTVAPVSGDSYMIVDTYYELKPMQAWEYDAMSNQGDPGTPINFSLIGDADDGEVMIYPVPYRSSGVPWAVQQRYYADLMRLDLASTTMTTLYRRWRNLFIQGVKWKCMAANNDDRAKEEKAVYYSLLQAVLNSEKYGVDAPADIQFGVQMR